MDKRKWTSQTVIRATQSPQTTPIVGLVLLAVGLLACAAIVLASLASTYLLPPAWAVFTASLMLYLSNLATLSAIVTLEG